MQASRIIIVLGAILGFSLCLSDAAAVKTRTKRAAYALPDGVEFYIGDIRTTFQCPGDGYYGDIDNDCKLFHICITHNLADGTQDQQHFSFACGNQTVFNQFTMTCSFPDDAVPCNSSPDFYYLNELLYAGPDTVFHSEQDVDRAALYGTRLSGRNARVKDTPVRRANDATREEEQKKK